MTKEQPVIKVELLMTPMFPVTLEEPQKKLSASITNSAAESKLTAVGDVALADICENE